MDKVAKLMLNSLRCPVCGGQIDLISYTKLDRKPKDQNFSCVYDPEHYGVFLVHWEQPPRIEIEQATVYEGKHKFHVKQYYYFNGVQNQFTNIVIREVDPEHRVVDKVMPKEFHYDKHLFDFKKTTRDKLVNRIKTILVFQ